MSRYYLMAQLPSLDAVGDSMPLPITQERFYELCERCLDKKQLNALKKLTLKPSKTPEPTGSAFIDEWNNGERELRLALAKVRAEKLRKSFDGEAQALSVQAVQAARTAAESDDPMEAEKYLNRYRLELLESLRPTDGFSENAVYYYGLKLKLIERIKRFDESKGQSAYRNIYNSIMRGEKQEATQ